MPHVHWLGDVWRTVIEHDRLGANHWSNPQPRIADGLLYRTSNRLISDTQVDKARADGLAWLLEQFRKSGHTVEFGDHLHRHVPRFAAGTLGQRHRHRRRIVTKLRVGGLSYLLDQCRHLFRCNRYGVLGGEPFKDGLKYPAEGTPKTKSLEAAIQTEQRAVAIGRTRARAIRFWPTHHWAASRSAAGTRRASPQSCSRSQYSRDSASKR